MPAILRKQVTKEIILDPVARLKQLTEYGSSVEIDKAVPIKRYFRSGAEMERQVRLPLDSRNNVIRLYYVRLVTPRSP